MRDAAHPQSRGSHPRAHPFPSRPPACISPFRIGPCSCDRFLPAIVMGLLNFSLRRSLSQSARHSDTIQFRQSVVALAHGCSPLAAVGCARGLTLVALHVHVRTAADAARLLLPATYCAVPQQHHRSSPPTPRLPIHGYSEQIIDDRMRIRLLTTRDDDVRTTGGHDLA